MSGKNGFFKAVMAVDKVFKGIEIFLVGGSVIIMAAVLAGNFISRNVFNASWTFAEEVGSFMLIIQTFAGLAYCARKGRHIRMSALFDQLSPKLKRATMIGICVLTIMILVYLGWLGIEWVVKIYTSGKVSSVLRIPMYLVYLVVPFGLLLGAVQFFVTLLKNVIDRENIWVGTETTDFEAE